MNLEPIEPRHALEMSLTDRENNVSEATPYSHRSRLGHFIRWCEDKQITNLNKLTGWQLHEFRLHRGEDSDLATTTEKTQMDTLRAFVRWLDSVDGVETDLHTKVLSPTLSDGDNVRDERLEPERATVILDHLQKFSYASRPHVGLTLMWHTMMRVGEIRAIDCDDYDSTEQFLRVAHRADSETSLKNQSRGELYVALADGVVELLDDWIANCRSDVTDEHDRNPLIATEQGRANTTTLRRDWYRHTRPCEISGECPHNRAVEECDATTHNKASQCLSSLSPHALRRGGITHALSEGWPMKAIGTRANVTETVLSTHYDSRSEKGKKRWNNEESM